MMSVYRRIGLIWPNLATTILPHANQFALCLVSLSPKHPASSGIVAESRAVGRGEAVVGDPEDAVMSTKVFGLGLRLCALRFIAEMPGADRALPWLSVENQRRRNQHQRQMRPPPFPGGGR
jgi:hypothetical protein